jgi:hypothetical protein
MQAGQSRWVGRRPRLGQTGLGQPGLDLFQNFSGAFIDALDVRSAFYLGLERRLVGIVDSGKTRQAAGAGLPIHAFYIPLLAHRERSVHVDLKKSRGLVPDPVSGGAVRRHRRHYRDHAVTRQQCSYKSEPPDVFLAIRFAEAEVAPQLAADYVAVQKFSLPSAGTQTAGQGQTKSGFSRTRESG